MTTAHTIINEAATPQDTAIRVTINGREHPVHSWSVRPTQYGEVVLMQVEVLLLKGWDRTPAEPKDHE